MIIGDKFVFIHVPKTGGQSIHAAIGGRVILPCNSPRFAVDAGDKYTFGFVRNPWARLVSLYRFLCQRVPLPGDAHNPAALTEMGFRAWLDCPYWMHQDRAWGWKKLPPLQKRPQVWWLDGCRFVGRFENMERDFADVCWIAGIKPSRLPHLNATEGIDWREEYDVASRDFVGYYFASDIKKFGYKFDEV